MENKVQEIEVDEGGKEEDEDGTEEKRKKTTMKDSILKKPKGNAQAMLYASVLLREKELPTPEGEDLEWIRLFRKAYYYWWRLPGSFGCHWALEADKYDFLDQENIG